MEKVRNEMLPLEVGHNQGIHAQRNKSSMIRYMKLMARSKNDGAADIGMNKEVMSIIAESAVVARVIPAVGNVKATVNVSNGPKHVLQQKKQGSIMHIA